MRGKKVKKLRKMFRQEMEKRGMPNHRPMFDIRGQVVEVNLWRAFKHEYTKQERTKSVF